MKYTVLASLLLSAVGAQQAYATCYGNVYSLNAGRGHVGILIDVQESDKLTNTYNGDRALAVSRAAFSGAAMTYNSDNNRLYYVSSPRPTAYHVQGLENLVSADEFNSLDFHASQTLPNQLAYYDPSTGEHTVVGDVPATFRMAYDGNSGLIYASDNLKIFTIDPSNGATTVLANFESLMVAGGFTSWGDFIFYEGELLFITNTRAFSINTTTGAATLKFFHYLDFVTGATLDQNGQILASAKNQNVTGNVNSTWLWRLNPQTGEKASVGLIPARLSALATNTQETYTCYPSTVFPSDMVNDVGSITTSNVNEGDTATFTVTFDKDTAAAMDIDLQLIDGTATLGSDYSGSVTIEFEDGSSTTATLSNSATSVSVPAGNGWMKVKVNTVEDSTYESNETFSLKAWFRDDESDAKSASVAIINDDYQNAQLLGNPEMTYRGVWGEFQNGLHAANLGWANNYYAFNTNAQGQGAYIYQNFYVVPGQQYSVNTYFWAQNSGTGGTHGGEVKITNASTGAYITGRSFSLREGNTTQINFNFTAPTNANYLRIQITNTSVSCCVESTDLNVDYARVYGPKP